MNKYLISILISSSASIFFAYYSYLSSPLDICNYIYCFEYIKFQELATIYLSIINIGVIIYGLNSWKHQTNLNRTNQVYKDLLDVLDEIEISRSNYELIFNTLNEQLKLNYDPQITLTFYEQIKDNLKENRYLDINKISKYNSKSIYLIHYFPKFDYNSFNATYIEYLNCLDAMCDYHFQNNQTNLKHYYEKFKEANIKYQSKLKKLRILVINSTFIK